MAEKPASDSSDSSFPVLAISIIGIVVTSIVLLSYYLFVTNCCINWQRFRRNAGDHRFAFYSANAGRGLDECAIQSIPNFRYQRRRIQRAFNECSVCLNEFQEEERIRMLPVCFHIFHIDCIDAWLQTHKSCPICRAEITTPAPPLLAEQSFERESEEEEEEEEGRGREVRIEGRKKSMGDECIGRRGERGDFGVQAMRRSFSLDSSNDRLLCVAVQEILKKRGSFQELSNGEGSSGDGGCGKVRRSLFLFGHSRSSKSAVLPI